MGKVLVEFEIGEEAPEYIHKVLNGEKDVPPYEIKMPPKSGGKAKPMMNTEVSVIEQPDPLVATEYALVNFRRHLEVTPHWTDFGITCRLQGSKLVGTYSIVLYRIEPD